MFEPWLREGEAPVFCFFVFSLPNQQLWYSSSSGRIHNHHINFSVALNNFKTLSTVQDIFRGESRGEGGRERERSDFIVLSTAQGHLRMSERCQRSIHIHISFHVLNYIEVR